MVNLDKYMKEQFDAEIVKVEEGPGFDFVLESSWPKWIRKDGVQPLERTFLQVTADLSGAQIRRMLMLPKESGFFKSNLAGFMKMNPNLPNDTTKWVGETVKVAPG
ncbi:unnamed protein product, partial [marine sediment metagenome]